MITVLTMLVGFISSSFPLVFQFFKQKADHEHEYKMFAMEMEASRAGHQQRLVEIDAQADIAEITALHAHDTTTGVGFIDGLRGSVRPVITYLYMAIFIVVETVGLYALIYIEGVPVATAIAIMWSTEVHAGWMGILSYWFGGRGIKAFMPAQQSVPRQQLALAA